jgi:methyl coenzyme M reductase subunit C-like uncharacterized protein (methanogenesis marker protein 7)
MPSLSSLDLARMISTNHMNVPVIIASGGQRLRSEELLGGAVFVAQTGRTSLRRQT